MKNESSNQTVIEQSHRPRKPKSREVSSRFLSPTAAATTPLETAIFPSPNHAISPGGRRPVSPFSETRKPKTQLDDSGPIRRLWPSFTSSKLDTLADHLGNDRRKDRIELKNSIFDRQRSSFENEKESAKENHKPVIGGSMRYTGRFKFPGQSNSSLSSSSKFSINSNSVAPRRFSVDENALKKKHSRRIPDKFSDSVDSGLEYSDGCSGTPGMGSPNVGPGSNSRKLGMEVSSKYMSEVPLKHQRGTSDSNLPSLGDKSPKRNKFTIKNVMRRAHSLTATTQWALSPGRTESPTMSVETKGVPMSFSSLKPPTSPSKTKTKGVEKLLNLGLDLFKSKKSSNSSAVLVRSNLVSSASSITDIGHQLRLLHNRLMQWRYANGRAGVVNENVAKQLQANVLYAWDGLTKLRHSVVQKKLKLEKEKLDMKLNSILHSQLKPLESWGDKERQHMAAVSSMKECLHSVVCRVPLTEGAEVDTQSAAIALRHASDLTTSVKLLLATFSPLAEQTAPLLSQLAEVVAQEKLLLEECRELFKTISTLEIEERSLKSSIIQFELWKQEQLRREDIMP